MPNYDNRRKSPRIYDLKPTTILLKDHPFKVNDISNDGMGLIMEKAAPQFITGERLDAIPIPLESGAVNVKGVISHISITSKNTIFGIQFLFGSQDFKAVIQFKEERTNPSEE